MSNRSKGKPASASRRKAFLKAAYDVCKENNVLFIADEIQTGLGRTGKLFACDWEDVVPDMYILGKALGGGVFPISCVVADRDILSVFEPARTDRHSAAIRSLARCRSRRLR
ncbi:Ornithine aminotransferase [Geobacillus sp. BCO2]|nr:Ornithine aminotransferase [Geobacillus sp. BCO2]